MTAPGARNVPAAVESGPAKPMCAVPSANGSAPPPSDRKSSPSIAAQRPARPEGKRKGATRPRPQRQRPLRPQPGQRNVPMAEDDAEGGNRGVQAPAPAQAISADAWPPLIDEY